MLRFYKVASWWLISCLCLFSLSSYGIAKQPDIINLSSDERTIQVWHWSPDSPSKGTILFSHGAASAPEKYTALIDPWVAEGYTVYAPLHVDSTDHPQHDKYQGMASWTARLQDMQRLADTYGNDGYIAAGHSYGALTVLVKGGATALVPQGVTKPVSDERVSLVLALSPPGAIPGFIEKEGYATLSVPALIQTGTQDIPVGSTASWETHLDAYNAVPAGGNRYALVLDGVDHYFGGLICRPELPGPQQSAQFQQATDITLLMMQAYADQSEAAKKQLTSLLGRHGAADFQQK